MRLHSKAFLALVLASATGLSAADVQAPSRLADSTWARLSTTFSEDNGYFPSDNLVTNEDSYLPPIGTLKRLRVTGGAYIGVAPDQNFSYIAAVRPRIAFIVDIRRDNLLELSMFKAIFALSRNRLEYLCLLFGRPAPADTAGWGAQPVDSLLKYIDTHTGDSGTVSSTLRRIGEQVAKSPLKLSDDDRRTIERIHLQFIAEGPALRWTSGNGGGFGRSSNYIDFRSIMLQTDRSGKRANYLVSEADWQFLKSLNDRNLLIPVTGDFGGPKALVSVARYLKEINETVSMFYTSNVEQYTYRNGIQLRFVENVAEMPRTANTVMVRSYFNQGRGGYSGHPQYVQGFLSTQVMQKMNDFVTGSQGGHFPSYWDLVTKMLIEP